MQADHGGNRFAAPRYWRVGEAEPAEARGRMKFPRPDPGGRGWVPGDASLRSGGWRGPLPLHPRRRVSRAWVIGDTPALTAGFYGRPPPPFYGLPRADRLLRPST